MASYLRISKMASRRFHPLRDEKRFKDPLAYKLACELAEWGWSSIGANVWEKILPTFKARIYLEDDGYVVQGKEHDALKWFELRRGKYNGLPCDEHGNIKYVYMELE